MEQESRAGCILHGCGVLAAAAASPLPELSPEKRQRLGFFLLSPKYRAGMAGMGAAGVFPAGAGRRSLRPAAVRSGQRAADTL